MNKLVSLVVVSYNQRKFISEALLGAFAQTYTPLEIIFSDDMSDDGTWEEALRLVEGYSGPHSVRSRRTSKNRGLIAHINDIMEEVQGSLVVINAGDDVSIPDRVKLCYEAWEDSDFKSSSIWSEFTIIDEHGVVFGIQDTGPPKARFSHQSIDPLRIAQWRSPVASGCTQAWVPELFRRFGPLPNYRNLVNEDSTIFFRAALLTGKATKINIPLVLYRRHQNNCSASFATSKGPSISTRDINLQRRTLERLCAVAKCFLRDALNLTNTVRDAKSHRSLVREICSSYRYFLVRSKLLVAPELRLYYIALKLNRGRKALLKHFMQSVVR